MNDPRIPESEEPISRELADIARRILCIQTLECRSRDALDFHELHVTNIAYALEAAYEAGRAKARRAPS